MASEKYEQLLDRAARLWGIDPEFWDIWGRKHVTSGETKRALLRGLGVEADTAEGLEKALARHFRKQWTHLLPPCLVALESEPLEVPVSVPEELAHGRAQF